VALKEESRSELPSKKVVHTSTKLTTASSTRLRVVARPRTRRIFLWQLCRPCELFSEFSLFSFSILI
jgi:hypothetical protein